MPTPMPSRAPALALLHALLLALVACSDDTPAAAPTPPTPVPAPVAPTEPTAATPEGSADGTDDPDDADDTLPQGATQVDPPAPAPTPTAAGEREPNRGAKASGSAESEPPPTKGVSLYDLEPDRAKSEPAPSTPAPAKAEESEAVARPQPTPVKPSEPSPETPPAPFKPPSAAHVSLSLPKGLRNDLARDTRMKPWLDTAVSAANRCYENQAKSDPKLAGVVVVGMVMHENARPSAEIKELPGQLSSVVACVTSAMMNAKRMPLFTGKEGQRYTAKVRFTP